jgi:hypothetical protein
MARIKSLGHNRVRSVSQRNTKTGRFLSADPIRILGNGPGQILPSNRSQSKSGKILGNRKGNRK